MFATAHTNWIPNNGSGTRDVQDLINWLEELPKTNSLSINGSIHVEWRVASGNAIDFDNRHDKSNRRKGTPIPSKKGTDINEGLAL